MLPETINHQDYLLSIDTSNAPLIKDVLPGIDVWPLFLDIENGVWVLRALFHPGVTTPKHFHTGSVHLITLAGSWYYFEYPDQVQKAGSYLYEPGGSIHQFHAPESNTEPTDLFMVVYGANVNFDEEGNFVGIMDAGWIESAVLEAAKEQGIALVDYVRPGGANFTAKAGGKA